MSNCRLLTLALTLFAVGGCSESATETTAVVAQVGVSAVTASAVAATIPTLGTASTPTPNIAAESATPSATPANSDSSSAPASALPLPDMGDLFAPPKVVVAPPVVVEPEPEPEPEPTPEPVIEEPKKVDTLPVTRLVGFVEVESLKALLSVDGTLNVLTLGESAGGVEMLAIEPPQVTLKYGQEGEPFQLNLYEQPWFHPASAVGGDRKPVGSKPGYVNSSGIGNHSSSGPSTSGQGNSIGPSGPMGAPQIPGVGPSGVPGVPGFGGMIGPPEVPGIGGNPSPGFPSPPSSSTPPNSKAKSTKKSLKSITSSGMPGLPNPPGPNGAVGSSLPGVGEGLPGAGVSR